MLIMVPLSHMNQLLRKRGIKCPDCNSKNIEYKPTKLTGLEHAGNWCLPDSANFAFAIHTLGTGIKFAQLQKLFLSKNFAK